MAILERRPWLRQSREALEASKRETGDGSAPAARPAGANAFPEEVLRSMCKLAKAIAAVEARLVAVEKIMARSSSATVTAGSVTGTVTPIRNANAERQRRYRERKRHAAARP